MSIDFVIFSDRVIDSPSKVSYAICAHLISAVNATPNYTVENTWGYKNPKTGQFDGLTGQLLRGDADVGGTVFFILPSRLEQMDFISMTVHTRLEFVFRAPPLTYVTNIYYLPFVGLVWISTILLLLIGSAIVYITYHSPHQTEPNETNGFISDVLLLAAGLFGQMGTHLNPRSTSSKIAMVQFIKIVIGKMNIVQSNFFFYYLDFIIDLFTLCVYIVHSKNCCITSIDNKQYSNIG